MRVFSTLLGYILLFVFRLVNVLIFCALYCALNLFQRGIVRNVFSILLFVCYEEMEDKADEYQL